MAREIVVQSWCDVCLKRDDTHTPSTWSGEITIGKTRQLDLCDDHAAVVRTMVEMLDEYGATATPPRPRRRRGDLGATPAAPYSCPECERGFVTPQGLGAHRARSHGYRAATHKDDAPTLVDVAELEAVA